MNIAKNQNYFLNFKGIIPPYSNRKGYHIIPIEKNPSMEEINQAIETTKYNKGYSGMNGTAYIMGQDLIVKKYKSADEALNYNPMREINVLDSLYDNNVNIKNSQKGEFAFKSPDGSYYLVSTLVKGETALENLNILNYSNIASIVENIAVLDAPVLKKTDGKMQVLRPMHYDLSVGNIKFNDENAGIFDFEYLNYENLDKFISKTNDSAFKDANPHFSDFVLPSNLRSFEHRTLIKYLEKTDNPREVFTDYLKAKSDYCKKMSRDFNILAALKLENEEHYLKLAKQYEACANVFDRYYSDDDIIKSEAIKIQISRFIFESSSSSSQGLLNSQQIKEYFDEAREFFNEKIKTSTNDSDLCLYYINSLRLINVWDKVNEDISSRYIKPEQKDFSDQSEYERMKKRYDKFISKLTDERPQTLDEILLNYSCL